MQFNLSRSPQHDFRPAWRWLLVMGLVCAIGLAGLRYALPAHAQDQSYTVRANDTWSSVAARFGLSVAELQAANPQAIRANGWLYRGETLTIPGEGETDATTTTTETPTTYTVQAGDWWINIAERFGVSVSDLRAANPQLIRPGDVLYRGDVMTIPGAVSNDSTATVGEEVPATATAAAAVTETTTASSTAVVITGATTAASAKPSKNVEPASPATTTLTVTAASTITESTTVTPVNTTDPAASATVTATATITAPETTTATAAETITETITKTATSEVAAGCPAAFADYPAALEEALNGADGVDGLNTLLQECKAQVKDGVQTNDWTGDGQADVLVLYTDPQNTLAITQGDLIIFDSTTAGYTIGYHAKAAGRVELLASKDINRDQQPDIAWSDETCGASTCFHTVEVISWTGAQWSDWTEGTISMAFAEITLKEVTPDGQGDEFTLSGGVYGSVGAGPQRSRTEVWSSVKGAPYGLASQVYAESKCLYHTVLDANEAFLKAANDGFGRAELLYTQAATDQTLEKCSERADELAELRSFSLYRLALIAAYAGKPEVAGDVIASLSATYPDSAYDRVGQIWLASYQEENNLAQACTAVQEAASENLDSVEILADYGYANPTFTTEDVCPVLDVEIPGAATTPVTTTVDAGTALTVTATTTTTAAASSAPVSQTASAAASSVLTNTIPTTLTVGLPPCPADLSAYPAALPGLLAKTGEDEVRIDAWLRQCDALNDERGGFTLVDTTGDKRLDAIFWPTVVSDLGFGPKGTQGDMLIYHAQADGSYKLVADEEIYGQPTLLATEDLNGDGKVDLAWQVVGCSTFCVLEAQIATWNGTVYSSTIRPGATIAEGVATFAAVDAGSSAKGKQLVLTGGVSGTPEGGLTTPHTEIWQSVKGGAFQRTRWTYDRSAEGNDCLGLRLIEADVALQAASAIGYKTAVDLYTQAVNPTLKACSVYGMAAVDELKLLQGLASFRLIQAQLLSGNTQAARSTMESLTKGQPDSLYTQAAAQWLAEYEKAKDGNAACAVVQPIFDKNEKLWQITDHFGYNHPPMAAEQICYMP